MYEFFKRFLSKNLARVRATFYISLGFCLGVGLNALGFCAFAIAFLCDLALSFGETLQS